MDILLIGGLWLDGSTWDKVVPELTALGHHPVPLTLPGQGDGTASATLDDQSQAVVAAVDAAPGTPLVVGHSAASTPGLTDERRFDVPAVVVCPEFTPAQAEEWIAVGESPELARVTHLEYVDLDSGHWPMVTRPRELARVLAKAATPSFRGPGGRHGLVRPGHAVHGADRSHPEFRWPGSATLLVLPRRTGLTSWESPRCCSATASVAGGDHAARNPSRRAHGEDSFCDDRC
ncbi:alpha/beta fold hydrolase [Streptomyces sp. NPDC091271]|uniref:alpha/beta fold hydrolase n=1 Tax=Streptomyces sp. NPDC091271 TaxID=3365980 RepID=UPI00382741E1